MTTSCPPDPPSTGSVDFVEPGDAGFLDLDRRRGLLTHMGSLWVFENELSWSELLTGADDLADRLPRLRKLVRTVPFRGHAWVDDPAFSVEIHVREGSTPPGGEIAAVLQAAGAEFGHTLERSKPLWDVTLYRCPPITFAGRPVRELYPLAPGIGVPTALSAVTYDDHLHVGLTVHAGLVPDASRAVASFQAVIATLIPATGARQALAPDGPI